MYTSDYNKYVCPCLGAKLVKNVKVLEIVRIKQTSHVVLDVVSSDQRIIEATLAG